MSMAANIRSHVSRLPEREMFTSRDLIVYGPRGTIDQTIYLLVKKGVIVRLARGVFMRETRDGWRPSLDEIVLVKSRAFHRVITAHPDDAANRLGLTRKPNCEVLYACSSRSSSFKVGSQTVRTIQVSPRLIALPNNTAGTVIRGLSSFSNETLSSDIVRKALFAIITKDDRISLRDLSAHLPQRILAQIPGYRRTVPPKFRIHPGAYEDIPNSTIAS